MARGDLAVVDIEAAVETPFSLEFICVGVVADVVRAVVDAALSQVVSEHAGGAVGRDHACVGDILCKGKHWGCRTLAHTYVYLIVGKTSKHAAVAFYQTDPRRVFCEVGLGACQLACVARVEAVKWRVALGNAELGVVVGVVVMARGLTIRR